MAFWHAQLNLRLLLVEDHAGTGEWVAVMLRACGCSVELAHSGHEAVAAAARVPPDIVLLDLRLPDFDGFEVARRIRQQPCSCQAAFIAITGQDDELSRERARMLGFVQYLVKPIATERLIQVLADLTGPQSPLRPVNRDAVRAA